MNDNNPLNIKQVDLISKYTKKSHRTIYRVIYRENYKKILYNDNDVLDLKLMLYINW